MGLDSRSRSLIPRWKRGHFSLLVDAGGGGGGAGGEGRGKQKQQLCVLGRCRRAGTCRPGGGRGPRVLGRSCRGRQGRQSNERQGGVLLLATPRSCSAPPILPAGVSPTRAFLVDHTER